MALERISHLDRLPNSVYGNPRYRVNFAGSGTGQNYVSGHSAITSSDSSFCYGITNPNFHGRPVRVKYTRAGRISDIRPVSDDEAVSMRNHPATAHLFE